jgi:hypothetical protein
MILLQNNFLGKVIYLETFVFALLLISYCLIKSLIMKNCGEDGGIIKLEYTINYFM